MRRRKEKKKGFTLIEIVAGLAMFAIVSTVIMNMIIGTNKHNGLNKNQFDTHTMSKAFNEAIKTSRPAKISGIRDWNNTDESKGKTPKAYYIGVDKVEDLTDVVKNKLLFDGSPSTTDFEFKEVAITETIETASNNSNFDYGILVAVQKKEDEKVYLFDTVTMNIPEGILTSTTRQFAISSEV